MDASTDNIFEAAEKGDIKVRSLSGNKECPYMYCTLVWQNAFSPDYDLLLYVAKLTQVLPQSGVSKILGNQQTESQTSELIRPHSIIICIIICIYTDCQSLPRQWRERRRTR